MVGGSVNRQWLPEIQEEIVLSSDRLTQMIGNT